MATHCLFSIFTVPLSMLRLGTPPRDSKEPSPPSAPIKPRGAGQRNSIAKLLATKRNNVAKLISKIETKEAAQHQKTMRTDHDSEQPAIAERGSSHKKHVQHESRRPYNHCQPTPVQHHNNTSAVSHSTPQSPSPLSPPSSTRPQMDSSHIPHYPLSTSHNRHPNPPSPASPTVSFSLSHTHPAPLSHPRSRPMSPKSPSPQLTYSPPHSMTHAGHTHTIHTQAISHSHPHSTPKSPVASPPVMSPRLATAPHLFQAPSLEDNSQSSGSLSSFHGSLQSPPAIERQANASPADPPTSPTSQHSIDSGRVSLRERQKTSGPTSVGESDKYSQRKSLPDLLSSSSPKSK